MNITQVPASPRQWGLSSLIPGVPGRLGFKVDKLILHWMDATLESTDRTFQGKTDRTGVSAHFGVEDGNVHQYVALGNVAWHAGNWNANLTSVGIEHSAAPGRDATDSTYGTSAELICAVCRQLGLVPSRQLLHRHSEYRVTACPGTLDLDRLASLAVSLWNGRHDEDISNAPQGTAASYQVPISFRVRIKAPAGSANFRRQPTTSSPTAGTYPNGAEFDCDGTVAGQSVTVTFPGGLRQTSDRWYVSVPDRLGQQFYVSAAVTEHL